MFICIYFIAIRFHPDINKAPDANERFREIQDAYKILSDREIKRQYDDAANSGRKKDGINMNAEATAAAYRNSYERNVSSKLNDFNRFEHKTTSTVLNEEMRMVS